MSFIKKLWQGIKHLFRSLPQDLKHSIKVGVVIVDAMKSFVESPGCDILTAIIPGDLDDKIKIALRATLPKIFIEMKLAASCTELTDPNEIALCAVKTLQKIGGDWISDGARKNFYDSLAVLAAQVAADGKLDWSDGKVILKWYYDNEYNKQAA